MHDLKEIVINTGPLLGLVAATGSLLVLRHMFSRVVVPHEVAEELRIEGPGRFGVDAFLTAHWLEKRTIPKRLAPFLVRGLHAGEASVGQTALDEGIATVCIDESVGRRVARLCGLQVTGSIGVLVRARREGHPIEMTQAIQRMRAHGIWIAPSLETSVLRQSGEMEGAST